MLCRRCSHRLLTLPTTRSLSNTITRLTPTSPPPATSTSAAQPFSTPFTPSPSKTPGIPKGSGSAQAAAAAALPKSSTPAGTPLKGLGYVKGQEPPLAREDSEYPSWLWGLLSEGKKGEDAGENLGDAFAKSKKQRRLASKAARARISPGQHASQHTVMVPLDEQSIDLPSGMGEAETQAALEAREGLRGAMRTSRRKKIKEENFLRGMR